MATLLSTVQQFAQRKGLPSPLAVMSSTDAGVIQMKALLEKECIALAARGQWQTLINEMTFLSLSTEIQGTISAGLGSGPSVFNGYRYMLTQIMWDRTQRIPILGAVTPQDYQYLKAIIAVGPWPQFRWRGDELHFNPVAAAGHTIAFEYQTSNWCSLHGVLTNGAALFVNDDDTMRLPGDIVLAGLEWRWLKEKGLAYAEDFNTYEDMVSDALSRDRGARVLNLAGQTGGIQPAVIIPLWNTIPP
jgi:hypothetical protein